MTPVLDVDLGAVSLGKPYVDRSLVVDQKPRVLAPFAGAHFNEQLHDDLLCCRTAGCAAGQFRHAKWTVRRASNPRKGSRRRMRTLRGAEPPVSRTPVPSWRAHAMSETLVRTG